MITRAMVMAAGLGTRLKPFTQMTTKALLPVMGIPMIRFALDSLEEAGIHQAVVNIHHDASRVRDRILSYHSPKLEIHLSDESEELLGSAGGILHALPLLGKGPFFGVNADVLCDIDWRALEHHHQRLRSQWGVSLTLALSVGPPGGFYREVFFDSNRGLITGLGDLKEGAPFYIGAAVLETESLKNIPSEGPSDFIAKILEPAIREGKAGAFFSPGTWYDIGSPRDWLRTHLSLISRLETGDLPSPVARLWKHRIEGQNTRIGERIWISKQTKQHPTTTNWVAPCYWGDGRSEDVRQPGAHFPQSLGTDAVFYGQTSDHKAYAKGIGYGGVWHQL